LRRIITIGTGLAVLAGAAVALAAGGFNSYKATETFSPGSAGSAKHPSPFTVTEDWKASGNNGHKTAPLVNVMAKVYGEVTDAKDFPKCTAAMINNAGNSKGWNKVCPKGSLIGSGPVESYFVAAKDPEPPTTPPACDPLLSIYNGGVQSYHGKPTQEQVFFFSENATHECLGGAVPTGAAPAYPGYITPASKGNGETWSMNIPLPKQVSTEAGGEKGVYASLIHLHVTYKKLSKKVHGKTVYYGASFACKGGQRPYSFTFKAVNYQGQQPPTQTTTVSHTASCG
jgi:hypothetical protein